MRIDTKCVQAGYTPKNGEPRVLPIAQSTTYLYETAEQLGNLFDLEEAGFFYTRLGNPTCDAVERKIAELEGGVGAMLTAAGQSASLISITNICKSGDHVICSAAVYGGTFNLFNKTLRDLGIDFSFVDPCISREDLDKEFKENTKAVFAETITNPSLDVIDIEMFAEVSHSHNVPLIIDNTFATPVNCRPFEFGADIIVHSTSKYLDGHACSLGGCLVDSGNFDWTRGDYKMLTTPDETYHGVIYTESFGKAAYITKARTHLMRDYGVPMSPQNAFLLGNNMETLHLRMARHCENALKVAKYLEKSDKVEWVNYPGLQGNRYYDLAKKYMPGGTCGVVSFGTVGGKEGAAKFMNALKLAKIVCHVADARTSVLHPASTTHRQLTDQQLKDCGVEPNMIRFSVGIEDAEDIIEDIEQALDQI